MELHKASVNIGGKTGMPSRIRPYRKSEKIPSVTVKDKTYKQKTSGTDYHTTTDVE
jgi:hypothetical protein